MSDGLENPQSMGVFFVDLDGSLVTTDLLWENVFQLIKQRPGSILMLAASTFKGRDWLEDRVAGQIAPETAKLPYNQELIEVVRTKRAEGVQVVLVTGSVQRWAKDVASHLGYFNDVIVAPGDRNARGGNGKLEASSRTANRMVITNTRTLEIPTRTYRFGKVPKPSTWSIPRRGSCGDCTR